MTSTTKSQGITFKVHDVVPAGDPLEMVKTRDAIDSLLRTIEEERQSDKISSCSGYNSTSVAGVYFHPLIAACHFAFSQHRPIVLSPDMIWLTIVQGLAQHIKNNTENLRPKFVGHSGKSRIEIFRDDIYFGSPETDWQSIIDQLSGELRTRLGPAGEKLVGDFSTTGDIERTVLSVALLDAFQPYFEYTVVCVCGIPEITLEGVPADWQRLREKVEALAEYEIDFWLPHLQVITDQFHRASLGDVDTKHWRNIYKQMDSYGASNMNGWIIKLIPYLKSSLTGGFSNVNPMLTISSYDEDDSDQTGHFDEIYSRRAQVEFKNLDAGHSRVNFNESMGSVTSSELPGGISMAPFTLEHQSETIAMQFLGGFVGIDQDENTLALRPKLGWAVRKSPEADRLLTQLPAGCTVTPALSDQEIDDVFMVIAKKVRFTTNIPGDLLTFYRQCDGLECSDEDGKLLCEIRSLKEVVEINSPMSSEEPEQADDELQITVLEAQWLRFCDLPDGSYICLELQRTPRVFHHHPASGKYGLLEVSFGAFVRKLLQNNGRLYKDVLN